MKLGAFSANSPEIYEYDQFVYSSEYLEKFLTETKSISAWMMVITVK